VRLLHSAARVTARFAGENVVSLAGLVPVMRLAEDAGLYEQVAQRVRVKTSIGSNPAGKVAAIVAGMAAGADSIDDLDVLRHGGMDQLFGAVYAPSTLGSFLREFSFGHVRQLEAAARGVLVELAATTPLLGGTEGFTYVDVDSLLRRVYGHAKQGVGFGHTKVGGYPVLLRGLSPLVATICTDAAAPVVAATRLRGGKAGSARGAASLVAEALGTAEQIRTPAIGAAGETARHAQVLLRADSAFYTGAVISAARRRGARFSVTVSMNPAVRRAIERIDESAWIAIRYPNAVFDDEAGVWISEAELAEICYTAFAGTKHEVTVRLVVRRVRCEPPPGQDELLPAYRYHAFITDTALSTVDADVTHRGHAVIEQVFADLIDGPLAHLPSGRFAANAAWLTCAGIAHNLLRAAGCLTSRAHARARAQTLRRRFIHVAATVVRHARGVRLDLPTRWPWAGWWMRLFDETHSPPLPA
jgi:Transposase DDE domain group 1